jgi:undecaprenyl-diphosphatase
LADSQGKTPVASLVLPVAVLLAVFGVIAAAVSMNATTQFDRSVILLLRESGDIARPLGPPWLTETFRDLTAFGSVVGVFTFAAIVSGYWLLSGNGRRASMLLGSAVGSLLLNELLKLVFDRARPDAILQSARVFSSGFPSGHATLSCTAYFSAAMLLARSSSSQTAATWLLFCAAFVVVAIGFSRIYLGVHYPSDVLAGWCVGGIWVLSANRLFGGDNQLNIG